MPVIIAQVMLLIAAGAALFMYMYVHMFSLRRLRRHGRQIDRAEDREAREAALANEHLALAGPSAAQREDAVFYLYHEQVRRFIDAKIDIIRSAADTQNRILLLQAKEACERGRVTGPVLIGVRAVGETAQPVHNEAEHGVGRDNGLLLSDSLEKARLQVQSQLDVIDQQMHGLPNPLAPLAQTGPTWPLSAVITSE